MGQGRRPQQHGNMAIMAAGMHHPGNPGGKSQPGFLPDGQGIQIGPQGHNAVGCRRIADGGQYPGMVDPA